MSHDKGLVLLAKLDAQVTEKSRTIYTRHGTLVWKRDIRPLGKGGFGEVYREKCTKGHSSGALRAIKIIQKPMSNNTTSIDYSKELEAVARFSQPRYRQHFVESFGWYELPDTVFIAMQYIEHGDLQRYVGECMPEGEVRSIALQVMEGLGFMHELGYAHRDLKPANLLVSSRGPQWHIKMADFGLSKNIVQELTSLRTQLGTFGYMAPEILGLSEDSDGDSEDDDDDALQSSYTFAVDVWAVGVICFQMLTAQLPFRSNKRLKRYTRGKIAFPIGSLGDVGTSPGGSAWIQRCLALSPIDRPTTGSSLEHSWLIKTAEIGPFEASQSSGTSKVPASSVAEDGGDKTAVRGSTDHEHSQPIRSVIQHKWQHDAQNGSTTDEMTHLTRKSRLRSLLSFGSASWNTRSEQDIKYQTSVLSTEAPTQLARKAQQGSLVSVGAAERNARSEQDSGYQTTVLAPDSEVEHGAEDSWELVLQDLEKNIETRDGLGRTPLQAAAEEGYVKGVEWLLAAKAKVDAAPTGGRTALQAAAGKGHVKVVELLLAAKADVNAAPAEDSGRTALQAAAEQGNLELIELLLAAKADINAKPSTRAGRTALQAAVEHGDIRVMNRLLLAKADVNAPPGQYDGVTALQAAARGGNFKVIERTLAAKANVNTELADGSPWTLLHKAVGEGDLKLVRLLLDFKANANAAEGHDAIWTPLQIAAGAGNRKLVKILRHNQAHVNAAPAKQGGRTAIQAAAEGGHLEVMKQLLLAGADVNAAPGQYDGLTALQAAESRSHYKVVELLRKAGAR